MLCWAIGIPTVTNCNNDSVDPGDCRGTSLKIQFGFPFRISAPPLDK